MGAVAAVVTGGINDGLVALDALTGAATWFAIGMLVAAAWSAAARKAPRGRRRCPRCAEKIRVEARVCRYCSADLPFRAEAPDRPQTLPRAAIGAAAFLVAAAALVGSLVAAGSAREGDDERAAGDTGDETVSTSEELGSEILGPYQQAGGVASPYLAMLEPNGAVGRAELAIDDCASGPGMCDTLRLLAAVTPLAGDDLTLLAGGHVPPTANALRRESDEALEAAGALVDSIAMDCGVAGDPYSCAEAIAGLSEALATARPVIEQWRPWLDCFHFLDGRAADGEGWIDDQPPASCPR